MTDQVDLVLSRIEQQQRDGEGLVVPADATPLQFLEAVYRSPSQPMHRRLKAACEALPFVHPKLSVIAQVGPDFAGAMERAFRRSAAVLEPPVRSMFLRLQFQMKH